MIPAGFDTEADSQIQQLAIARFDGDLKAAYRAVLEAGLDAVAVPRNPGMLVAAGDLDRVRYTETNTDTNDGLALRTIPQTTGPWYRFGEADYLRLDRVALEDTLTIVSRYDGVHHDSASFSIADHRGQWYGWSFTDFVTALRETDERYRAAAHEPMGTEWCNLFFAVEDVLVLVKLTHDIAAEHLHCVGLELYASGEPIDTTRRLHTIADHFGGTLGSSSPFSGFNEIKLNESVEPIAYLTRPFPETSTVDRVVIDCDIELVPDSTDLFPGSFPREVVLHLRSHTTVENADGYEYRIRRAQTARLDGGLWNVTLRGNWYDR